MTFTTNDVIRVTCLVYNCGRADLITSQKPIFRRRRAVAVTAAIRLGLEPSTIGQPFAYTGNRACDLAEEIEKEASRNKAVAVIVLAIEEGVKRRRAA